MKREAAVKQDNESAASEPSATTAKSSGASVRSVPTASKEAEAAPPAETASKPVAQRPSGALGRPGTAIEEIDRVFAEMDRMFDVMTGQHWMRPWKWEWPGWRLMQSTLEDSRMPMIDMIDRDEELVLRAELPGVESKDLNIDVSEKSVTVSASRKRQQEDEAGEFHRCEISQARFARTIGLPTEVVVDNATAQLENGLLEVHLPKVRKSRRRSIEIR